MLQVRALVSSTHHVCVRYRLEAFRAAWQEQGCKLVFEELPTNRFSRFRSLYSQRHEEITLLQRKTISCYETDLLADRAHRFIYDFDDAVWLRDSYSNKGLYSSKQMARFRRIVRAADTVVAGNQFLLEQALDMGAKRARLIPTCVDPYLYPLAEHSEWNRDLVWIGSSSTLKGIQMFGRILDQIHLALPKTRLRSICDHHPRLERMPVVEIPWKEETEAHEIAKGAIGISWLPEDDWSRGKCGLKILQYMAAGLPVVTNDIGVHREMVHDGLNGFLVKTPAEWIEAIRFLQRHPQIRQQMGMEGRRIVEEKYSIEVGAAAWLQLMQPSQPALVAAAA
ncbi:MAG: glycosyltransferase family 4 protein [Zavarzinella sp.]